MSSPATKEIPLRSKKGREGRRRSLKGARGRWTLDKEKPPILGLTQRGGCVVMRMLANVHRKTIKPVIKHYIAKSSPIHTDEYDISALLLSWGYVHKTVCHSHSEYAGR
jgi:hypothetical protein